MPVAHAIGSTTPLQHHRYFWTFCWRQSGWPFFECLRQSISDSETLVPVLILFVLWPALCIVGSYIFFCINSWDTKHPCSCHVLRNTASLPVECSNQVLLNAPRLLLNLVQNHLQMIVFHLVCSIPTLFGVMLYFSHILFAFVFFTREQTRGTYQANEGVFNPASFLITSCRVWTMWLKTSNHVGERWLRVLVPWFLVT